MKPGRPWLSLLLVVVAVLCVRASILSSHEPIELDRQSLASATNGKATAWVVRVNPRRNAPTQTEQQVRALRALGMQLHLEGTVLRVESTDSRSAEEAIYQVFGRDAIAAPERRVRVAESTTQWNLDRIDQRSSFLNGAYNPFPSGDNGLAIHVYIVDTGIAVEHPDFGGRAVNSFTAFGVDYEDQHGHGTHVAGIVGSNTYGVANRATLHNVRVLDATGSGTTLTLARGLDYIYMQGVRPGVINLSLGYYGNDPVVDSVIADLIDAGYYVVAAAGNDASESCVHYPSALNGVISVVASDQFDVSASFNNVGTCVDLFAPGVSVRSTYLHNTTAVMTGTSMASPHVAGAIALFLDADNAATTAQIVAALIDSGTAGAIIVGGSTDLPNLLLYVGADSTIPSVSPSASPRPSASSTQFPFLPTHNFVGSAAATLHNALFSVTLALLLYTIHLL